MAKAIAKKGGVVSSIEAAWGVAIVLSQSGAAVYLGLISSYADWKVVLAAVLMANVVIELFMLNTKRGK